MSKYLLEIGTEELPHKFIKSGIAQLKSNFEKLLNDNKIEYSEIKTYSTPRRLALIIDGLSEKQPDTEKIVKGPVANIAFKEDGSLSPAGIGFAKKNNVSEKELFQKDNYVWAKVLIKGKEIAEVLKENAESAVLKLQGSNDRYVFINDNGIAKRVAVKLGRRFDDKVELLSDEIHEGDELIIVGQGRLINGSKLDIQNH